MNRSIYTLKYALVNEQQKAYAELNDKRSMMFNSGKLVAINIAITELDKMIHEDVQASIKAEQEAK